MIQTIKEVQMRRLIIFFFITIQTSLFGQFGHQNNLYDAGTTIFGYAQDIYDFKYSDIDNDGDLDILKLGYGTLNIFENLGNSRFVSQKTINAVSGSKIIVFDSEGDGDEDIFLMSPNFKMYLLENLGGGKYASPVSVINYSGTKNPKYAESIDLNNDGRQDIVTALNNGGSYSKIVYNINLGGNNFGSEVIVVDSLDEITNVFGIADVNGDNKLDIYFTEEYNLTDRVGYIENNGALSFSQAKYLSSTYSTYIQDVKFFDVDNDSDNDIVIASGDSKIYFRENTGGAAFGTNNIVFSFSATNIYFSVADVDKDGFLDFSYTESSSNTVGWFKNSGNKSFVKYNISVNKARNPVYNSFMDINNDSFQDLLVTSSIDKKISFYLNNGNNTFGSQNYLVYGNDSVSSTILTDFDNDGDNDIVSGTHGGNLLVTENLGAGKFLVPRVAYTSSNSIFDLVEFDFDNDGDKDLLAKVGVDVKVFENNSGVYTQSNVFTNNYSNMEIGVMDVDNDGYMDILTRTTSNSYSLAWLKNNGNKTFSSITSLVSNTSIKEFITFDYDNDNDLDIFYCNGNISVIENISPGVFSTPIIISNPGVDNITVSDVNNDGFMDIIGAGFLNAKIVQIRNLGNKTFASDSLILGISVNELKSADVDGDGLLDIVAYQNYVDRLYWFRNNGNMTHKFNYVLFPTKFKKIIDIDLSDLDNDGDIDLNVISKRDNKIAIFENFFTSQFKASGQMYCDINQNKIKDISELPITFAHVSASPGSKASYTNNNGEYFIALDSGAYNITYSIDTNWALSTDSSSYFVNLTATQPKEDSLDFGFYPKTIFTKIIPSIVTNNQRCGFNSEMNIHYTNKGTTVPSGIIELTLDDSISYISSSVSPDSIKGNNIYWSYDSLTFFEGRRISLLVKNPGVSAIGDTLINHLKVFVLDTSGAVTNIFSDSVSRILTCAYDPNVKISDPLGIGEERFVKKDDRLLYTVFFYIIVNDTAFTVIVRYKMYPNLDLSTL